MTLRQLLTRLGDVTVKQFIAGIIVLAALTGAAVYAFDVYQERERQEMAKFNAYLRCSKEATDRFGDALTFDGVNLVSRKYRHINTCMSDAGYKLGEY